MKVHDEPMRVLLVSTSYPRDSSDWRGVFIRHLVYALSRSRCITLSVWAPPGELPTQASSVTSPGESHWLDSLMKAGGISHLMRRGGLHAFTAPLRLIRMLRDLYSRHTDVDIYHINWLQCALPLPRNKKPALITVLGNDLKLLRLPFMQTALKRMARGRKVTLCPNADWMHAPLNKAFGSVATIKPINFGIDPRWFAIERSPIAPRPKLWLAVTRLTADKLGPLFEWSRDYFSAPGRELHLFGPMQEQIEVPSWVFYHGSATPEQLASQWFPHATGLVTLSRHAEGRPQVMLEAMASGLPIIASRMPAHASMVDDNVTGVLCDSLGDYHQALTRLEDEELNSRFGLAAREWARHEIGTWDDCAQRYISVYRTLLENKEGE
jgi:glycosyltransferase involved in cell wall biosynthesis